MPAISPILLMAILALVLTGGVQPAWATPSACDADVNNLVQNCGFEGGTQSPNAPDPAYVNSIYQINGSPNGWTQVGDWGTPWNFVLGTTSLIFANADYGPHSGNNALGIGNFPDEGLAGVSQAITDVNGATYQVSFWLRQTLTNLPEFNGPGDQAFRAYWNGTLLISEAGLTGPNPWTEYIYDLTGTGLDTLEFVSFQYWGATLLDDVQFDFVSGPPASAPEPTSLALFGAALAGLGIVLRRKRKTA